VEASGAARRRSLDVHLPNRLGVTPLVPLSLPLPPLLHACRSNECVDGSLCERQASEDDRSIDVEGGALLLRAVRGWRRVTALVRASVHVYGSWCPVSKGRGQFLSFRCGVGRSLHRRGKKIQPVRARRAFKKVVFLSIDPPIFARLVLSPPLICDCRRSWFVFVVWVTVEQSLTDGWGYTVRSRTMPRIGITSSIYATTPRQENNIQDTRARTKSIRDRPRHHTASPLLAVGPAKEEKEEKYKRYMYSTQTPPWAL